MAYNYQNISNDLQDTLFNIMSLASFVSINNRHNLLSHKQILHPYYNLINDSTYYNRQVHG